MTAVAHTSLGGQPDTLVIEDRMAEGRAVLTARGELVHGCAEILARTLDGLPARPSRVELDMTGVEFMDTAGLQFLDVLSAYGRRHHIPVRATHWNGQPRRILELAGLDTEDPLRHTAPAHSAQTVPAHSAHTAYPPAPRVASAVALERAEQLYELRTEVEQLRHAIVSRPVIDQARGVLMATHACTSAQAWDILREASQHANTKLREVAAAVTAGAASDGPAPPEELRRALHTAISHRLRDTARH